MFSSSVRRSPRLAGRKHQGGEERRCSRNRNDRHLVANGQSDQPESGVGNSGHAGVGYKRDPRAAFEIDHQLRCFRHFVVLVVTDGAGRDPVMIEKLLGLARVFTGDQVDAFQHAQGAQGDVLEVADGRGNEVERWAGIERLGFDGHGGKDNIGPTLSFRLSAFRRSVPSRMRIDSDTFPGELAEAMDS